jgi:hypothetical protein
MPHETAPLLVTEKETARMLGLSDSTLIANRFKGTPLLPFVRIGKRSIRYRVSDIHDFVNRNSPKPAASVAAQGHGVTQANRASPESPEHASAGDLGSSIA